jgi:hypothetical protein
MQICNACRYCEGFCAVFPAMTRRLDFGPPTCTTWPTCATTAAPACTPASTRRRTSLPSTCRRRWRGARQTYAEHAWPPPWARCTAQRPGLALALAAGLALFLALAAWPRGNAVAALPGGNFYEVFPHGLMVACSRRCSASRCWRWAWACALLARPAAAGAVPAAGGRRGAARRADAALPGRRPWRGLQQRGRCLDPGRRASTT